MAKHSAYQSPCDALFHLRRLYCEAGGSPPPLYSWLDPQKRNLSSVGGYHVDTNRGTLLITKVHKDQDDGLFTCVATNGAGIDQMTTPMKVLMKPRVNDFKNITGRERHEATFECRAQGEPKPVVYLRRDGDNRPIQGGDERVTDRITYDQDRNEWVYYLTIKNLRRLDDGLYYCVAENNAGSGERVGHLQVEFSPDLSRTPATLVKTWQGNQLNVTCIADAIPNATVRWFFNGRELSTYDNRNLQWKIFDEMNGISHLNVNPSASNQFNDVYGVYKCLASNPLGDRELLIELQQAYVPGPPIRFTPVRTKPTSILFNIYGPDYDGGLPVKKYWVEAIAIRSYYGQPSQTLPIRKDFPAGDLTAPFKLDNLDPKTSYEIKLAAENDVGMSQWSPSQRVDTPAESAPEPPAFITVDGVLHYHQDKLQEVPSKSSLEYSVSWTTPEDNGKPIDYYELVYYRVSHKR